jgi:hypothetical protein
MSIELLSLYTYTLYSNMHTFPHNSNNKADNIYFIFLRNNEED